MNPSTKQPQIITIQEEVAFYRRPAVYIFLLLVIIGFVFGIVYIAQFQLSKAEKASAEQKSELKKLSNQVVVIPTYLPTPTPEYLKEDLPRYPNSTFIRGFSDNDGNQVRSFQSKDALDKAISYYSQGLEISSGWSCSRQQSVFVCEKQGKQMVLSASEFKNNTNLLFTYKDFSIETHGWHVFQKPGIIFTFLYPPTAKIDSQAAAKLESSNYIMEFSSGKSLSNKTLKEYVTELATHLPTNVTVQQMPNIVKTSQLEGYRFITKQGTNKPIDHIFFSDKDSVVEIAIQFKDELNSNLQGELDAIMNYFSFNQ